MRKPGAILSLLLIGVLTLPGSTGRGLALTSAEAVDQANAYPNVGTIMVWRGSEQSAWPARGARRLRDRRADPPSDTTHGGTLRRAQPDETFPMGRVVVSFAPNALDASTWIDINRALGTCFAHPSFPRPCTPRAARSTTSTDSTSLGSATWGCAFSTNRRSASARPNWRIEASTTRVSPGRG